MKFIATGDTDIGIARKNNQDSLLIKHGETEDGEVLMAIVCDGMGGLAQGELASATVVRAFHDWFDKALPYALMELNLKAIGNIWSMVLKECNRKIMEYGEASNCKIGTTFTGMLFIGKSYLIAQVGDTRAYHIGDTVRQLTQDQTVVAREVRMGRLTPEAALTDKRRNVLLQCVGASKNMVPEILYGTTEQGTYMLCSDGFRHVVTEDEMQEFLNTDQLPGKEAMHRSVKALMEMIKRREEKDNMSAILIRAE